MIRILYHSVSRLREDSPSLIFNLMTLLDESITYNARHGITGVLAYRNSAFLHVLEGPVAAVDDLYGKICADWRHRDVRLIARESCLTRGFADWSMAYLGYEHDLRALFAGVTDREPRAEPAEIVGSLAGLLV